MRKLFCNISPTLRRMSGLPNGRRFLLIPDRDMHMSGAQRKEDMIMAEAEYGSHLVVEYEKKPAALYPERCLMGSDQGSKERCEKSK